MSPQTLRLFIAIELPVDLKRALANLQEELQQELPSGVIRWVRPDGIHLTLKFLGNTPADKVDAVKQGMIAAAAGFGPFSFAVSGFGCFPNPRKARVLWVGIPEIPKALAGLQRATELQMTRLGWQRESHPFRPHLTLGRVNKKASADARRLLAELIPRMSVGHLGTVAVEELVLFRSELQPGGAVYTALARAPLAGSA